MPHLVRNQKEDDNGRVLFKSSFAFDKQPEKVVRQTSASPTHQMKSLNSPSFTPVSFSSRQGSPSDSAVSANSASAVSSVPNVEPTSLRPLELHVPPLNASLKRRNSTFSLSSPSPIQYESFEESTAFKCRWWSIKTSFLSFECWSPTR